MRSPRRGHAAETVDRGGQTGQTPASGGAGGFAHARRLILAVLASLSLLGCALSGAPSAFADEAGCPNEAVRTAQDATMLPECRAWELVTPAIKDNSEARFYPPQEDEAEDGYVAASTGERLAWISEEPVSVANEVLGTETFGREYLSTRGPTGWTSENQIPKQSVEQGLACSEGNTAMLDYTPDLSKSIFADGGGQNGKSFEAKSDLYCGHNEPALTSEEPEGFQNIFVRDNNSRSYELVDLTPHAVNPDDAWFDAGSNDFSHVVFTEDAPLTTDAPMGWAEYKFQNKFQWGWNDIYEWVGGSVKLVSYLPPPAETPVQGRLPWDSLEWDGYPEAQGVGFTKQPSASQSTHTVSADGSRIFFEAEGALYVREDGKTTVQIDASQGSGPGGGGKFMEATRDGSKVFFTDEASAGLTATTVPSSGVNLYEYDVPSEDGKAGTLVDLTPDVDAHVLGFTEAGGESAEEGSYAYFVAAGELAPGATVGQPNLYLRHGGETKFVAKLEGADDCDWSALCLTARLSPDGRYLAFTSLANLTGYDNNPANPAERQEVYIYEAPTGNLNCASCNPTGISTAGNIFIRSPTQILSTKTYLSRNVTDSGEVFFDTPEALVPKDSNGALDVYMYRAGRQYLISSGTQAGNSYFIDASEDGANVFFITQQKLVRRDEDSAYDIYDARVDGGYAEQGAQSSCGDEGCRGLGQNVPLLSLPDSASLISSGNVVSPPASNLKAKTKPAKCKKGLVEKKGKCVKKIKRKVGKSLKRSKKSAKGSK